ncbi:MAG TPA: transferrin-binding protein-like solute binding protein [Burkholderiales bacterium]|nr:transferrin-binding protein-like solute binding protein [Burkholderiales bacterium]
MSHNFTAGVNAIGDTVTSVNGTGTTDTSNSSITLGFDASRNVRSVQITTPAGSVSITNGVAGGSVGCGSSSGFPPGACTASDAGPNNVLAFVDPFAAGFQYQTFGVWLSDQGNTLSANVFSVGAKTPGASIPTQGTASYSGGATGFYSDSAGQPFLFSAQMSANANFGTRTVAFSTTGTTLFNANTSAQTFDSNLNLSGTLSYGTRSNNLTGTLTSQGGSMSGTAVGRFYGPNAQEIGGTFALRGSGVEAMNGAFGGKQ